MRSVRAAIGFIVLFTTGFTAQGPRPAVAAGEVEAAVIRSWSNCDSHHVNWHEINTNWPAYGTTPVHIDYSNIDLCSWPVTYETLVASGADVLIISDPAGAIKQHSASQIAAIRRYVREGHGIVGSYLFYYLAPPLIDDRPLLRLFGLPVDTVSDGPVHATADYHVLVREHPLFTGIHEPFASAGLQSVVTPVDGSWGPEDLAGAQIVARTKGAQGVITTFHDRTYGAVYVSSMPEFRSGSVDAQFWYNAIVYTAS